MPSSYSEKMRWGRDSGVTKSVQNEIKEQKRGFLSMLLGPSLLGNLLTGRGVNKKGKGINRSGEGVVRAVYRNKSNKMDF